MLSEEFLAGIKQAVTECGIVSISWGGPESSWDATTMDAYEQVLSAARARGVAVFVASGDTGSRDGTSRNVVDFPASSPSVIACGGTQLHLNADGSSDAANRYTAFLAWLDDAVRPIRGGFITIESGAGGTSSGGGTSNSGGRGGEGVVFTIRSEQQ